MCLCRSVRLCTKLWSHLSNEKDKKSLKGQLVELFDRRLVCVGLELSSASVGKNKNAVSLLNQFIMFLFYSGYTTLNSLIPTVHLKAICFGLFDIFKIIPFHWIYTEPNPGVSPLQSYIWTFSEKQDVPLMTLRWTKPPSVFCVFTGPVSLLERKQSSLISV